MTADAELVGRTRELEVLGAALDDATAGHGAVVTISGEPGVGKTAVARAFATVAAARGAAVVWGGCFEGASQPPYGPWAAVLRAVSDTGELPAPEARLRLFASVVDVLRDQARDASVVVVVDDL